MIKKFKSLIDNNLKVFFFILIPVLWFMGAGLSYSLQKEWILIVFLIITSVVISLYLAFWGEIILKKKVKEKK